MFKQSLKTFIVLLSFINFASAALDSNQAENFEFISSSIPDTDQAWMASLDDIGTDSNILIRVKIFPHTLRRDGKHGVPDDKKQLELKSRSAFSFKINGTAHKTTHLKITSTKSGLSLRFGKKRVTTTHFSFETTDTNPVTLYRVNNVDKSHYYEGKIEIKNTNSGIVVINELPIEKYLRGVVPSESPASWPLESLKAQAVAARSYSYYHYLTAPPSRDFHVDDTARYQVFGGLSGAMPRTDIAIKETDREILTYNNNVIVAFFHSYSGGTTDSAKNIFKTRSAPYCAGDEEIFSREDLKRELSPKAHWIVNWETEKFASTTILKKLKAHSKTRSKFSKFSSKQGIDIIEDTFNPKSGTVQNLIIRQGNLSANLDFTLLRTVIGWSEFPAYHYRVHHQQNDDVFTFKGYGWGHHVGMSQWGAFMMSKHHSKTYRDILEHYYFQTSITKI